MIFAGSERYRVLEHTADMGMEIWGETMEVLFQNAGYGFSDLISDVKSVGRIEEREVRLQADDREALLVRWLHELLFLFDTERILFSEFLFSKLTNTDLCATVRGELFDPSRHSARYEIKAVTYHGLEIVETEGRFRARVLFDI